VRNTVPARESKPRYFRPAFKTVNWNEYLIYDNGLNFELITNSFKEGYLKFK
jgi:hypothetical protein